MGLKVDYETNNDGLIIGVRYESVIVGHGLPFHAHSAGMQYHNVECVEGEVFVFGYGWFKKLLPGEVFNDFDKALPHAVSSLSPAVWFNRLEVLQPPEDLGVPEEYHRHTTIYSPCDVPKWVIEEVESNTADLTKIVYLNDFYKFFLDYQP